MFKKFKKISKKINKKLPKKQSKKKEKYLKKLKKKFKKKSFYSIVQVPQSRFHSPQFCHPVLFININIFYKH